MVVDLSNGVIRHALLAEQPHKRHGTYHNRFQNALIFGHHHLHAVITDGMRFDCQDIGGYHSRLDYHVAHHPGRELPIPQIVKDGVSYRVDLSRVNDTVVKRLPGTAQFGTPIEPLNWGMWLLQGLPIAHDFAQNCTAERYFCHVGRDWQRDLLRAVGINADNIVHQELGRTYHCEDLIMRQYSHIDLVPTAIDVEIYNQVARQFLGSDNIIPRRKIFVSRQSVTKMSGGRYRALQNENALTDRLAAEGFEIVEPERLSLPDQIRLFREAEYIVGLGGAGLFNVVFSRPGTRVVSIESSAAFVHGHALLFASLGHPFGVIFGKQDEADETPIHKRWSIDVDAALSAILAF